MQKTAEAVSLGHPDKTCDYISSYILDRMIEQDKNVRYAVEVMIKDNTVVFGGEVSGHIKLKNLEGYVKEALAEIGYTKEYSSCWKENAINPDKLKIVNLIGAQSVEIGKGVDQSGWGDQGIFVGYACQGEGYVSKEQFLAQKLNKSLYEKALQSKNLGIDIKTQITLDDRGGIDTVIVAIPMLEPVNLAEFVFDALEEEPRRVIINGTGTYKCHSSIADCGVTGRKLACDFYSGTCPVGGGSPWTKDASKADLTLNLYARKLALENLKDNDECFVYLSSCIGQCDLPSAEVKTIKDGVIWSHALDIHRKPSEIIEMLGLNRPVFAKLCREGLMSYS
ncbi:MAG: methionine adenosyltransferase domain-containing protein [Alphaproteobacteria bacterium]|nr:methionine adenosyltransferase domain-containing protein [Alphaproteobacteria bacterium]